MASSVEGTRFDCGHCQAEPSSGFGVRQPLEFAKQSNGTQIVPKPRDGLGADGATFFFGEGLFRGWAVVGQIDQRSWVDIIVVGFKKQSGHAPPPQHHQRFIDCYTRHPSCECGIPAKIDVGSQMHAERTAKRHLPHLVHFEVCGRRNGRSSIDDARRVLRKRLSLRTSLVQRASVHQPMRHFHCVSAHFRLKSREYS